MLNHIDQHGPKYIIFVSLVTVVALILYQSSASHGQLELSEVIYDSVQMIFATVSFMSGTFSFLLVMVTSATQWGAVAGFRTYVGIGALVELVVSITISISGLEKS